MFGSTIAARASIYVTFLVFVLFSLQRANAQSLDAAQLDLIKDTVADICATVSSISGSTTTLEIEAEVAAELRGLSKKFVDAGASASGKHSEKEFEGLTQDATAEAIQNSAMCRERLFVLMFEKISNIPDKVSLYERDERRDDLRTVQRFILLTGPDVRTQTPCIGADHWEKTREIRFVSDTLQIENFERTSSERCTTGTQAVAERVVRCQAPVSELDEGLSLVYAPQIYVNCISGDCFECTGTEKWRNKQNPAWTSENFKYSISRFNIHIDGHEDGLPKTEYTTDQYSFARALARLISGGDDSLICAKLDDLC